MISNTFYNRKRLIKAFLGRKVAHYPIKDRSVTIEWYDYVIKYGESIFIIAQKIFGKGKEYMWTYIADNNPLRHPDEWREGEIIRLPKVIIRDSDTLNAKFDE